MLGNIHINYGLTAGSFQLCALIAVNLHSVSEVMKAVLGFGVTSAVTADNFRDLDGTVIYICLECCTKIDREHKALVSLFMARRRMTGG